MKDCIQGVIKGYHAHVYFDGHSIDRARRLCSECARLFSVKMGRIHERPVGPHPDWSCQLTFAPDVAGAVIGWLALNRDGLVVFIHPDTGQPLQDHTEHAIWMGSIRELDLARFEKAD